MKKIRITPDGLFFIKDSEDITSEIEELSNDKIVIVDINNNNSIINTEIQGEHYFILRKWQVLTTSGVWGDCIPLVMYPEPDFITRLAYFVSKTPPAIGWSSEDEPLYKEGYNQCLNDLITELKSEEAIQSQICQTSYGSRSNDAFHESNTLQRIIKKLDRKLK